MGLVTTFNEAFDRVAMHGVRMELVEAWQSHAVGIPLWPIPLPWPCSNEVYERRIRELIDQAREVLGITQFAFGDLFLEDVRGFTASGSLRERSIEPVFPLWGTPEDTNALARRMIDEGLSATLVCVDPKQLDPRYAGRQFDSSLLAELPETVDACGERGEFHTFCHAGPMFNNSISIRLGEVVERDGFWFADLMPK